MKINNNPVTYSQFGSWSLSQLHKPLEQHGQGWAAELVHRAHAPSHRPGASHCQTFEVADLLILVSFVLFVCVALLAGI